MAIVNDQPGVEKEEDKDKATIGATTPGPQTIGGTPGNIGASGGSGGAGGGSVGAPAQQKSPTSSGAYTDIGKYVKANQPNIAGFAGDVAGQATDVVTEAKQVFGQDADTLEAEIGGGVSNVVVENDGSGITNAGDANKFLKDGSYGGPEDTSSLSTGGVQGAADLLNTEGPGGTQTLLQNVLGDEVQDYSVGERNLDALFLGGDRDARDIIGQAGTDANTALSDAEARKQGLDQAIIDARGQVNTNKEQARSDITSVWDSVGGEEIFNEDPRYTSIGNQLYDNLYGDLVQRYSTKEGREGMTKAELDFLQTINTAGRAEGPGSMEDKMRAATLDYIRNNPNFAGMLSGYDAKQEGVLQSLVDATGGTSMTGVNTGAQGYLDRGRYDADAALNNILNYFSNSENAGLQYGGGGNYVPSSGNTSTTNSVVDTLSDAGAAIGMDPIGQTERLGNAIKGMFG